MTAAGPLDPILENPGTALAAAAVGAALALAYLAAEYVLLLPAWRFRAARRRGPASLAAMVGRERTRLRRLGDMAAILEERGHADAKVLRQEDEVRRLLGRWIERRAGVARTQ